LLDQRAGELALSRLAPRARIFLARGDEDVDALS
jgi:hypothetical protein